MKRVIIFLALILIANAAMAGRGGLKGFYAQHRTDKNVEHITIPKILMYFSDNDAETRRMLKYMRSLKVFQMDGLKGNREAINKELESAVKEDGYESIMSVNESGERVNIYILQDRRYIRKFLLVVDNADELVLLQAKTKITFARLSTIVADYKDGKGKSELKKMLKGKS